MDEQVKRALAKWPQVPHCHHWLGLDARGQWWMRDEPTQAAGPFPLSKGSLLQHSGLIAFIHRNYSCDESGAWFFQNGPQRVYVDLEATPYIWRLHADGRVVAHTDQEARIQRVIVDEAGYVYLDCDLGFGLLHSLDTGLAADWIDKGLWVPSPCLRQDLPTRFGYCRRAQALKM